jgi:pyrimidine deaminase RibD-like protein
MDDRELMIRAIALARQSVGEPGRSSPRVGALVAREGVVIGEAYRGEFKAGEHAEFTVLERKLKDVTVAGATLFTTLEPCTVRNLPKRACVERVIERRIKRVVIGTLDPNDEIRGRGQLRLRDAGVEVALFDADLMAEIEELNRDFIREQNRLTGLRRSESEVMDPVEPGSVGPNGFRIGYTDDGDKVEWIPDDDKGTEVPLLLRRNDRQILETYNEFWDKVWWNRKQVWFEKVESGEIALRANQRGLFERAKEHCRELEEKYGADNLGWDDFEWGLLSGRLSALSWVMGSEWDESLDT